MAENNISATEVNRNISVSRLTNRQAKEQAERQSHIISRQESSQQSRDQSIVEAQTGRKIDTQA